MNVILIVINRLSKTRHFIVCRAKELKTSLEATIKMLLHYV